MIEFNPLDLLNTLPILVLVSWACALLMVNVFVPRQGKGLMVLLTALGLAVTLILSIFQAGTQTEAFKGMLAIDDFTVYMNVFILASSLVALAISHDYMQRMGLARGEYYVLMLFSVAGMMLMASAADLIVVFLALELLSIPLYVLSAFARPQVESEEAGLKYFLLGAFASGFLVYGIALVYGATGQTNLIQIFAAAEAGVETPAFLLVGAGLILVGLGFKVAAAPFHMWTPDVYQGAPTTVTAFMAVGAKAGGFAALLRVFIAAFPAISVDLAPVLAAVAAATLVIGNVVAVAQSNIKRLFAYSSISHAGFILMAFVAFGQDGLFEDTIASVLFYLVTFAIASFGSWAIVIMLERKEGRGLDLQDYAGLGRKYPALALAMAVFMFSFTGVPPTLGFAAKLFVFRVVIEGGYYWLAIVGVVTSVVSAYYYLRLIIIMYMQDGDPQVRGETWLNLATAATAVATVLLFFFSTPLFEWAAEAGFLWF
ncbi:MAG: NADH-quinone oxidoreductase subunit N [Chloroflexi bacterium]|nr:MAG: NADH-quinone oxidoreductase subunit N [Chloroflexota bacterium]MBL1196247.1 NADH-quinone oxidoreductase subunit N [Chloroflexota bacterium]NOH13542.1 NADH-quinone oxidoreductase subunit N [Chloroflexota bacterium]